MKKHLFSALLLSQIAFSQTVKVEDISKLFNENKKIEWRIPLSNNQTTDNIEWQERKSSFSSQGIRSFVGYVDGQMVGVISVRGNMISGEVNFGGKSYQISTQNGEIIATAKTENGECSTCNGNSCSVHHHENEYQETPKKLSKKSAKQLLNSQPSSTSVIKTDGILRMYRLAVLIDYSNFKIYFHENRSQAEDFLARLETFLNEIYVRELGIKFELVKHPDLIRDTSEKEIFTGARPTGESVINNALWEINKILGGSQNYDLGIASTQTSGNANGQASMGSAYANGSKANAWAIPDVKSIAHELGHMFGSLHTFSTGGNDTYQTEPDRGSSLMSYGHDFNRDFFSLVSIYKIKNWGDGNYDAYYSDKEKTKQVGKTYREYQNIPYGIDTKNQAPVIDRSKLKAKYQLPLETAFSFKISATDPDGDRLIYGVHQADIILDKQGLPSRARFYPEKMSEKSTFDYIPHYEADLVNFQNVLKKGYAFDATDKGTFKFWLGANDGDISKENHAARLDVAEVEVEVVEHSTPFKITSKVGNVREGNETKNYKSGQKTTLTWDVDKNIFGDNSRVRILMSDDFGKSWNYVLEPNTENDGLQEVIIPNTEVGYTTYANGGRYNNGLFRIEVIDHIAVAITDGGYKPFYGGFTIDKGRIYFETTPSQYLKIKRDELQNVENEILTAKTSCKGTTKVTYIGQTEQNNIITRTWEAKGSCTSDTAYFVQKIELEDETTLSTTEQAKAESIKLYPNPANDSFQLNMEHLKSVKVFDVSGTLAKSFGKQEKYDISDLPKGVFIVVVETDNGKESVKLIKN